MRVGTVEIGWTSKLSTPYRFDQVRPPSGVTGVTAYHPAARARATSERLCLGHEGEGGIGGGRDESTYFGGGMCEVVAD
jgi:hypothetical protein